MFFPVFFTNSIFVIVLFQAFAFVLPPVVQAQSLRSTFPGRRVGGGTRGECASRLIIHLVPKSSRYSVPAAGQELIGLVQGPSDSPTGLNLSFRPLTSNGNEEQSQQKSIDFSFKPNDASLILLSPGLMSKQTYIWESSFNCQQPSSSGEFDFITSGAPPALSLLTAESDDSNLGVSDTLKVWKNLCGDSIATLDVFKKFELIDLLSNDWPARLPIHCP
jgi:hypothetical protein